MMVNRNILTLDEFTIQQMRSFPAATGELSSLLRDIGLASKRINVEVNKAGLVDILGDYGTTNVQGEEVKKLDIYANNQLMGVLKHGISCAGIASEELDDIVVFDDEVSNNSVTIKNLEIGKQMSNSLKDRDDWKESSGSQKTVAFDQLLNEIK